MGYETAPATRMLATHCIFCSRPLVDAVSVEAGVGPDCRKKYGHTEAQGPADWVQVENTCPVTVMHELSARDPRRLCNILVYRIVMGCQAWEVCLAIDTIRHLGFAKLAESLTKKLCAATVTHKGDVVAVQAPWNEEWVNESRTIPGRRYIKDEKMQTFPLSSRPALWRALQKVFRGKAISTPKGLVAL